MNQSHQTQCPHCRYTFDVTDEQLELKSGFARCPNCHKIFSAVDYLLNTPPTKKSTVSANTTTPSVATTSTRPTPNPSISHQPTKTLKATISEPSAEDDMLFDDHAGLDETGERVIAPKTETYKVNSATRSGKSVSPSLPTDFDIIEDFDNLPTTTITPLPSSNKINVDEDESWLNNLLAEERQHVPVSSLDDKLTRVQQGSNDVTSMLEDLGVGVITETAPSENEYLQKVTARFQHQTASHKKIETKSKGMLVVWTLGSFILAGTLAAQYLIFNAEDMLKKPESAKTLISFCRSLPINCNLPVADLTLIETNTLSLESAKGDTGKTDLVMTLKNTSTTPNLYPNLKVTLRSGNETKAQFIVLAHELEANSSRLMPGQIKPLKFRIDYPRKSFDQANVDPYY